MRVDQISFAPARSFDRPAVAAAPTNPSDLVSLSGQRDNKKIGNAIAWTGFGIQCVGAAITLNPSIVGTSGWVGVGIFAVGAAMIVGGEVMKRR